jgi:hypothetical protein
MTATRPVVGEPRKITAAVLHWDDGRRWSVFVDASWDEWSFRVGARQHHFSPFGKFDMHGIPIWTERPAGKARLTMA